MFFLCERRLYIGYLINENSIRPSDQHIEAVSNYPIPRNIKETHRFVCLASYFRRFIPKFSVITKPLYNSVKKNAVFKFESEEVEAFERLKRLLYSQPTLSIYFPTLETELHCDASANGFAVRYFYNDKKTVFFGPCFILVNERRLSSLSIIVLNWNVSNVIYAIKRFHIYFAGVPFKIVTDCDSFRLTLSKQTVNPRIYRWALFLEQYTYEIVHRPGTRMSHVDALSRCHNILTLEAHSFERTSSIQQDRDVGVL